jgi:hypothetical protein
MSDDANSERQLAHMVYFTLKEDTAEGRQQLLDDCRHFLTDHEGVASFGVAILAAELTRPVNDLDFHISLHLVFENRAAHDVYQTHERHVAFIEKNKDTWAQVRIFDSYLQ